VSDLTRRAEQSTKAPGAKSLGFEPSRKGLGSRYWHIGYRMSSMLVLNQQPGWPPELVREEPLRLLVTQLLPIAT